MYEIEQELRSRGTGEVETGIRCGVFLIDPCMARKMLLLNHSKNRPKKPYKTAQMVKDMQEGRWQLTHQGIGFDEDGHLCDGQNRLESIIDSDTTQRMFVFFNIPRPCVKAMDLGTTRTASDASGFDGEKIARHCTSVANRMLVSNKVVTRTPTSALELLAFTRKHMTAIEFAVSALSPYEKGISTASNAAIIARAWYTQDRQRLLSFGSAMVTGLVENNETDQAAIVMRNFIKNVPKKHGGGAFMSSMYKRVERALVMYLRKEKAQLIREQQIEQFPLPGEVVS